MDPATIALVIGAYTKTIELITLLVQRTPPDVTAEQMRLQLEVYKNWLKFLNQVGKAMGLPEVTV